MTHQAVQVTQEQKPAAAPSTTGLLQRQHAGGAHTAVPPVVHDVLRSSGRPLDSATRAFMEPRFGRDFSRVRVHDDAKAAESARAVGALAYTAGRDIVLGKRSFGTDSRQGRELIAHELAHVVQQGGQIRPQLNDLVMTRSGDAAECEAREVAQAVVGGQPFRPPTNRGVALARQVDAGVPDAGASGGPRDAGPVAGVPGPAAPAAAPRRPPAPRPAAPSATIGAVTFRGSTHRIAPTQTATVPVTVSNLPAGASATIDVEGSGGANGTATITAGAALAGSGSVTVRGDTQTAPGSAGRLRLRATVGGAVVGRSPGFTVAAWPTDFTISRNSDVDTPSLVGLRVNIGCISDGSGALAELSEVQHTERVDIGSRDNPPFKSPGAISATATGTSGFMAATSSPLVDTHTYARTNIDASTLSPGFYRLVYRQNFLFNDRRTGVTGRVVRNSGFTITHLVGVFKVPFVGRLTTHMTAKGGAAVTVEGKAATAGSGSARSEGHTL